MTPHRASIRASDADREQVVERLRRAMAEGRLLHHELEDRLARAFRAKTYGELDALVSDLPRAAQGRAATRPGLLRRHPLVTVALIVFVLMPLAAAAVAAVTSTIGLVLLALFIFTRIRGVDSARRYHHYRRRQMRLGAHPGRFGGRW